MKKLVLFNLLFVALIGSTFTSCSKDETKNEDQVMEQTNAVIEHELDQATNFSDEAYNTGTIASDLTSDEMEIRHNCAIGLRGLCRFMQWLMRIITSGQS